MNRKLTRQICNEWRSNLWLVIELMVVSVAIWYMVNTLVKTFRVVTMPNGYETDDVYALTLEALPEENDRYEYPSDSAARADGRIANFEALVRSIESRPGVKGVATGSNIQVYSYNYLGNSIGLAEKPDSMLASVNVRQATPTIAEVLNLKPLAGAATRDELRKVMERGELVVTRSAGRLLTPGVDKNPMVDGLPGAESMIGQRVTLYGQNFTVGAVVEDMRRGYMEYAYNGNAIIPNRRGTLEAAYSNDVLVRVQPDHGREFEEDFKNNYQAYRAGQFYIAECVRMTDKRAAQELDNLIEIRNLVIITAFLLLTIFLGLLGTFWFRTSSRTSEIAVRKSVGASSSDIFRRLIGEGLLLLAIATVPAVMIDFAIARWGDPSEWIYLGYMFKGGSVTHLAICAGITFLLMALMTVAGIWLPARRAMHTDPAEALHAE